MKLIKEKAKKDKQIYSNSITYRTYDLYKCDNCEYEKFIRRDVSKGIVKCLQCESYYRDNQKLYWVWHGIEQRCNNKNTSHYHRYGGRGIKLCDEWKTFKYFLLDMGESYKEGLTIERINNNGNYCKENCRWASCAEQSRNKSNNNNFTHNGKTMCITDWCKELDLNPNTVRVRLHYGKSKEEALELI